MSAAAFLHITFSVLVEEETFRSTEESRLEEKKKGKISRQPISLFSSSLFFFVVRHLSKKTTKNSAIGLMNLP